MNTRASFIMTMAVLIVGLPACARQHRMSQQQAAADQWETGGGEPTYDPHAEHRGGAGRDLESRQRAASEQAQTRRMESEMEELGTGAQSDADRQQRVADACPMNVSGTQVKSREVPNGIALVFTTEEDVDKLREKVDQFAQLHNEHSRASSRGTEPEARREEQRAEQQEQQAQREEQRPHEEHGMMSSRAEVEEVDRGAQIILTPRDPGDLQALRQDAERQARVMSGGECPVM